MLAEAAIFLPVISSVGCFLSKPACPQKSPQFEAVPHFVCLCVCVCMWCSRVSLLMKKVTRVAIPAASFFASSSLMSGSDISFI